MNKFKDKLALVCCFVAVILGCMAITFGAWLIYQPAGFIVGGVLAATLGGALWVLLMLGGDDGGQT